jgi:hypothetical protein
MTDIPVPEVLDPDQVLPYRTPEELEAHHERVVLALRSACEYGRLLWRELDLARRYLLEDVARGGADGPVLTSQSLLHTERDWQVWARRYAAASAALAGPHGDEANGWQEARHEAQQHHHLIREA